MKSSAQTNLLDRLAGAIGSLDTTRPIHFIALLGLCAGYSQGGLTKLFDFNAAVTETQGVGYEYWHDKYGNPPGVGTQVNAPQFQLEWHF